MIDGRAAPRNWPTTRRGRAVRFASIVVVALGLSAQLDPTSGAEDIQFQELSLESWKDKGGGMPQPPPPAMVLVQAVLSDNGDNDGYADTNETVDLQVTVYNRLGVDVGNLVATLSTTDAAIACIGVAVIDLGAVADRATRTGATPFRFTIGDIDRTALDQDLSAAFTIQFATDEVQSIPEVEFVLDLDLDLVGGAGPTTFFEGFESGLGALVPMHLDAALNAPDGDLGNDEAGLLNSEGYRCQYSDPDWEGANHPGRTRCYLSPGQPDMFYFEPTSDRAFSGDQAVHWGIFLDSFRGFTEPFGQLEALQLGEPVNLARGRVCEASRTIVCATDLDCPIDETCVPVHPVLSLKHQISQLDHRTVSGGPDGVRGINRAVVEIQVADAEGAAVGPWVKLEPFQNAYDTQNHDALLNCMFDPVDDGNDEGSFFDPDDPARRLGPSSTCFPERTFVGQGETGSPFDASSIGDASDGPGLQGDSGMGTWVEARFDLGRYAGRQIRVRFLETSPELNVVPNVEQYVLFNPDPRDDGWFIDDVMITDTLVEPAAASVDTKPNTELLGDWDLDQVAEGCDCDPDDGGVWSLPSEARGLTLAPDGAAGSTTLDWHPPTEPGGIAVVYDVLRSSAASDFSTATCVVTDGSDPMAIDAHLPAPGAVDYFLVRAGHACGEGSLGHTSSGADRFGALCP